MKTKFKMITLTAVTALTLSFGAQSFAASQPFSDLNNVTAKDKIISLQEQGLVHGITNDLFAPNVTITAAQGVQLIVNALDLNLDLVRFLKEPKATDYFKNANDKAWYANALITASVNGLVLPADLDPNKKWTREEFTHQLISTIESHSNLPMIKLVPVEIADNADLTVDYDGSIQRALAYNVVELDDKGNFHPKAEISRAEAAVQIFNAIEYIKAHPGPTVSPEPAAPSGKRVPGSTDPIIPGTK
ncbi:S-layer homology domain-containing protein [Paenibacillus psychroresistens]|uniref:S-layer homology domain-containing protein n=1 Tax=Paenibacillus psychroresistens TaxID=1778678 RepID=A0A6B8RTA9_9BACL|nr:S-layer homology domain-containing protein [Paenibacillus psychroresistens]QGQ99720.1 S-layer homology domain-containing protein [Paenibacillus psychroresistens]